MKKIFWFAACCLLATGFASCSEDDEEPNGDETTINEGNDDSTSEEGQTPEGEQTPEEGMQGNVPPNLADLGIPFPVTSIGGDERAYFQYTDGRLTSGYTDGDLNFTISQNPLVINASWAYGNDESFTETYNNIQVNGSGFITSANYTATDIYRDETYHYTATATAQYDADGHITEKKVNMRDEESTDNWTITYTWSNGNLTRIVINEQYTETGYGTENSTETYEYTYDPDPAKNSNTGIYLYEMWYNTYDFMWYAGLLGKTTRNMPTGMTRVYMEDGVETYRETYTFTTSYNSDNAVASLEYRTPGASYPSRIYTYGYDGTNPQTGYASLQKKGMEAKKGFRTRLKDRMGK